MAKERKEREARGEPPLDLGTMDLDGPAPARPTEEQIKLINQRWEDNQVTSELFELIKRNDADSMALVLENQPLYAHFRSKDGRGPMWWAHEHGHTNIINLLKGHGVSENLRDKDGMTPLDLADDEF